MDSGPRTGILHQASPCSPVLVRPQRYIRSNVSIPVLQTSEVTGAT
jgi:hypothetical protein